MIFGRLGEDAGQNGGDGKYDTDSICGQ